MELWLGITLVAAFLQNVRSLLQKRITGVLSVNGATYLRFIYALPFAWAYAFWLWAGDIQGLNIDFFIYVATGAVAQILATACLLASFTTANFAVGTAFSKTEAAQAALFGLVLLGDSVNGWVIGGIAVSLVGVILLSGRLSVQEIVRSKRALWLGIAAGSGFAISAVGFRGASLALSDGDFMQRAGLTVMAAVTLQSILLGIYLWLREPGQLAKVRTHWRVGMWIGLIGMVASAGWFSAMTLKSAAIVRAVGQIELLFTVATSIWILGERLKPREIIGILLVLLGIWLLI